MATRSLGCSHQSLRMSILIPSSQPSLMLPLRPYRSLMVMRLTLVPLIPLLLLSPPYHVGIGRPLLEINRIVVVYLLTYISQSADYLRVCSTLVPSVACQTTEVTLQISYPSFLPGPMLCCATTTFLQTPSISSAAIEKAKASIKQIPQKCSFEDYILEIQRYVFILFCLVHWLNSDPQPECEEYECSSFRRTQDQEA